MTMKPRVNQFHSGTGWGDAVTQHMLELQQRLHRLGYPSNIYAEHVDQTLKGTIRSIHDYHGEPDDVLIVHHSMGYGAFERVIALPDRIITLFHNITPERFLSDASNRRYARIGRDQLCILANRSDAAMAVSNFNRKEMLDAGFRRVTVLPPRTDYSMFKRQPGEAGWWRTNDWLFVGRLVENKCQHDLIRAFAAYARAYHPSARLLLVGDDSNGHYVARLHDEAEALGIADRVEVKGKLSHQDLLTCYRESGLFVCLSEHEGFGVPLLEAMATGLPVMAFARAAVPETLGGAGILLRDKGPWEVAALAKVVLDDEALRDRLVARQFERLRQVEALDIDGTLEAVIEEAVSGVRRLRLQIQGPFETSYSLAVLNRHLALELDKSGNFDVSIYATEGPGDYVPDSADLALHTEAGRLYERSRDVPYPDVVVRQMHPPRVVDSPGGISCLYFSWEESRLPSEYVSSFNSYLDGIGATSSYVEQVLRDSGVTVPIAVVGDGVEPHDDGLRPRQPELKSLKGFRFLNIGSAFPRKGIDVLLETYFDHFTGDDDVTLILKTFPNPHNAVGEMLAKLRVRHPNPPDVRWIDRDLPQDQVRGLYNLASCYVHPARGEGFGLPVAEAMLARVPVITLAYGGLADFCSDETALTVPYRIEPARSHLSEPGSTWAEPDRRALGDRLAEIVANPAAPDILARTQRAHSLISEQFSWRVVGERWHAFISELEEQRRVPRIAMVTTWNSRCGIAEYSRHVVSHLGRRADVEIYADIGVEVVDEAAEEGVTRCWHDRWEPDLSALRSALARSTADIVHVQLNFGFFEFRRLAELVEGELGNRPVVITLHRTRDVDEPGQHISLSELASTLEKVDQVIVHQPGDVATLEELGVHTQVEIVPIGVETDAALPDRAALRANLGIDGRPVVATFGFLLPHKGILELIRAIDLVRSVLPDVLLIAACARHPDASSSDYERTCHAVIQRQGLERNVTLLTDFLPEAEARALLSASDLLVMPYKETKESASAALRFVLGAGRPIAAPDIPIFADAREALIRLPNTAPEGLARSIRDLLTDPDALELNGEKVRSFARRVSWAQAAAAHRRIYDDVQRSERRR
jgi:glycosyltransferase involved in cell wall biosynthesis